MFRITCLLLTFLVACGSGSASSSNPTGSSSSSTTGGTPTPTPAPAAAAIAHARCGWIGAGDATSAAAFVADPSRFDVIHPDWYALTGDPGNLRAYRGADDAGVLAAAHDNHVEVIPLIAGVDNASYIHSMISDTYARGAHIHALVQLATTHGYDGIDIDYEHQPEHDRAAFTEFMTELATAMHAAGKQVSLAVQGETRDATVWDYAALARVVDHIHIMGYDFHYLGSHLGPTSPLGWIQAVAAFAAHTGHPEKFILGLPNYGLASGWYGTLSVCAAACTGPIQPTTTEMETCPFNTSDHFQAGRAPSCKSARGTIFFDDLLSLEEKVSAAHAAGLGGIGEWTVGGEPEGFSAMLSKYYP
jgi:spore germination protein YaaH